MVVCVALTEVLKIVAEDRASATITRVANVAQTKFGASQQSAQRFAKALSGFVVESVVNLARVGVASFAAFGVAVAGLGYKALQSRLEFDRLRESAGGSTSEFLGAFRELEGSFDNFQKSLANLLIDGLKLPAALTSIANSIDKITRAIDEGKVERFVKKIGELAQNRMARALLLNSGAAGMAAGGLAGALGGAAGRAAASAAGAAAGGPVMRLSPISIKMTDPKEAERIRKQAAEDEARRERERNAALERSARLQMERNALIAAEKARQLEETQANLIQIDQASQAFDEKTRQRAKETTEQQKQAAAELASVYANVGSQIGGVFNAIIRGGMSAEDVMLKLIGTALSLASSIFLPGAGAAASGIFGFLGSIFGFQDGGVIRAAHGMRVPGVGAGDRVPALLEPGETVVPKGGTQPGFIEEVARAANGGGGNVTVNLSQSYLVPPDSVTAQRTYQRGLVPVLQDLRSTGRGSVTNPRFRGTARGGKRG